MNSEQAISAIGVSVALWVAMLQIYFSIGEKGKVYPKIYFIVDLVMSCRIASDKVFGSRLFSLRAFLVSLVITVSYFILFAEIAIRTSLPEIGSVIYSFYDMILLKKISYSSMLIFFIFAVLTDYLSICETRWLMRLLPLEARALTIVIVLFVDIVISYLIFIMLFPVPLVIISIDRVFQGMLETLSLTGLYLIYKTLLNLYFDSLLLGIELTISTIRSGFTSYEVAYVLGDLNTMEERTNQVNEGDVNAKELLFSVGRNEPWYAYPFTTLLATTFVTSIWIWIYTGALLVARVLFVEARIFNNIKSKIYANPRVVIYFGLVLNIVICLFLYV